jgi:adenylate kinase family enzyme
MRRVMVVGSGGAGKSTFARALGERTGLPVLHLDRLFWRAGWVETPRPAFEEVVRSTIATDAWILDGNYSHTMELRLERADTCVFLDVPRLTCLGRALRRNWTYRGRCRPDITEGCPEKIDAEFVAWIWTYPARVRPKVLEKLAVFERRGGRAVVLRSDDEVEAFLEAVRPA